MGATVHFWLRLVEVARIKAREHNVTVAVVHRAGTVDPFLPAGLDIYTGKPTYRLGDDFFKQMEDHWTFCSALADIYAVKEMGDQRRDDDVVATLPSPTEEEWEDDDNEAIETGDLLARLVVNELLSEEDTERELEEPAVLSDV
jgi:hypothetical protein